MIRVLLFFLLLIALAFSEAWLIDRPGEIVLTWQGYRVETSVLVGVGVVLAIAAALLFLWSLLRFSFRLPSVMTGATQSRRRDKGYAALSRGIIAVGAGDAELARKSAAEAQRYLRHEPLTLLLRAQAAQLSNEPNEAEAAFKEMTHRSDTRLLGFRGLHVEAQRRGETDKAHHFASAAHEIAPLPWTAKAGVEHRAATGDWQSALATLESSVGARLVDKNTRERQRAVLETAIALDKADTEPEEALRLARAAIKRQPGLVPALAVAARLLSRKGEIRKVTKLIESAWPLAPHPDLAKIYLNLRPGESNADRLARARALLRLAPKDAESRIAVAQTAIAAGDYKAARESMVPLIEAGERPTTRMCLIMADLEEAEHGSGGYVREWLARASRAPHDPAWVADGIVSDQWLPASPVTGRLDAFVWQRPVERLSAGVEAEEAVFTPLPASAPPPAQIEDAQAKALSPPKPKAAAEQPSAVESVAAESPVDEPAGHERSLGEHVIFPLPAAPDDPGQDETPKPRGLAQLF
ncbi:heme biosynthesis HemY N-terminal domain-containing protein [Methylocapsa polymorpha]|uniref:Heme biosynthesis HemY N-terminal domain-containing protein n=1 Tax=Methylocapsa polymorpha TaxID=3080828 RepID=A0ABZ0HSU5_9HYPH|nr:heme biosynthesis HemY N-terminal domain-containing protein [Methylocapsa sp. RX1]